MVGAVLSSYLAKQGYQVDVYEKRPDPTLSESASGRSINLAISTRAWMALRDLGLESRIKDICIPMEGRGIHNVDGTKAFQPYGEEGEALYSASRSLLNETLIEEARRYENVQFYFNHECIDVDLESSSLNFKTPDGIKNSEIDRVIAADGANSAVRRSMYELGHINSWIDFLSHGYKELIIPANNDSNYKINKNALHIWPRKNYMLIGLPNSDGSFTSTLFLPYESNDDNSFNALEGNSEKILEFFKTNFPDVLNLIPNLLDQYQPTVKASDLGTLYCDPWHYEDKVLLVGDAAHAIVPFYGQGMNAGFQDCTILDRLINNHKGDWAVIFETFTRIRKNDTDSLAALSLYNFVEMRDKVGDPKFLLQKEIEMWVTKNYPEKWTDLHYLVTFSDTSYAKAKEIGDRQSEVMVEIMDDPQIGSRWERGSKEKIAEEMIKILEN